MDQRDGIKRQRPQFQEQEYEGYRTNKKNKREVFEPSDRASSKDNSQYDGSKIRNRMVSSEGSDVSFEEIDFQKVLEGNSRKEFRENCIQSGNQRDNSSECYSNKSNQKQKSKDQVEKNYSLHPSQSNLSNPKRSKTTKSSPKVKSPSSKVGSPLKKSLMVTKGVDAVPVDNYFPLRDKAKVVEQDRTFYSATLTQSDLVKDDNKFFIIQALQVGDSPNEQYYLFTRWGRVGVPGQIKYNEHSLTLKEVIKQYTAKSRQKLGKGGYKSIDVTYEYGSLNVDDEQISTYFGESRLPWKVQDLIKVIFDRRMINLNIKEIGYDEKRSPLGLIAKKSIQQGYIALGKIMRLLKNEFEVSSEAQKRRLLNEYSGEFYSAIPHDFGYMKMQAFVLKTEQKVKEKLQMLASLSQIQIYSELMRQKSTHPEMCDIDVKYLKLKCEIKPLECPHTSRWIHKYISHTHAKTHDKYKMEVVGVFSIRREEELKCYRSDLGNKMMLWHGSRLSNYVGILSQGLKIAPFEAPTTGYMFGKGIYFADIVSKSANYCKPKDQNEGLLLICEVALGQMQTKLVADFNAHNLPQGYHSTHGIGKFAPSSGEHLADVYIPNGAISPTGIESASLLYNEYVVYNREQVLCRYIVHVRFHFK